MSDDKRISLDSKESDDGIGEDADVSAPKPAPKRRASRAGTRSVASLTPEQLARKRANDREAQRSIRQRTKNHIEDLERRIQDLSGDYEEKNIENLQRRNSELEEELRQLKEMLGRPEINIASSASSASSPDLTPLSSRYGMEVLGESHPYQYNQQWSTPHPFTGGYSPSPTSSAGDLLSSLAPDYSSINAKYLAPSSGVDTFNAGINPADMTNPLPSIVSSNSPRTRGAGYLRPNFGRSRSYPNGRLGQPSSSSYQSGFPTLASTRMLGAMTNTPCTSITSHPIPAAMTPSMMSGISQPLILEHSISPALGPASPVMKLSINTSQPMSPGMQPAMMSGNPMIGGGIGTHMTMPMQADAVTYDLPTRISEQPSLPAWKMPLRFLAPTGPVDSILVSLLQQQRTGAVNCNSPPSSSSPSLRALVNPEQSNSVHPVSAVIANLLQRTTLRSLPEKIGAMLVVHSLIQWQISPSQETYNNIPDWFVPRASQHFTAHPIWTSLIAWGKLRDVVIGNQQRYATEDFEHIYTASLNLNWPYRELDALSFEGDDVKASDAFVQHALNFSNWSLDEPFQRAYPELRDTCKFTEFPLSARGRSAQ